MGTFHRNRMTGMNTLPVIQSLYNSCRRAGVWARLVLKTETGKETVTFSTVSRPTNLPEEKGWKDGGRRKKPSKVKKKDRARREAWLGRRRIVEERTVWREPCCHPCN